MLVGNSQLFFAVNSNLLKSEFERVQETRLYQSNTKPWEFDEENGDRATIVGHLLSAKCHIA
eukprot:Pgem_evm1s7270